jgi:hypothetical protein
MVYNFTLTFVKKKAWDHSWSRSMSLIEVGVERVKLLNQLQAFDASDAIVRFSRSKITLAFWWVVTLYA